MHFKVENGTIIEDKDAPKAPEGARRPVVRLANSGDPSRLVVTFPFGWNGELTITAKQDPKQTDNDLSLVEPGDLTKRGYPIDSPPPSLNWEAFKLPKAPEEEHLVVSGGSGFGPSQEELEPNDEGPITFMGDDSPPRPAQPPLDEDELWERGNF
jgi:hypothetical protein